MLDRTFLAGPRGAGALLVGSFLVFLLALLILVVSGAMSAFSQQLQGSFAPMAPYRTAFRWTNSVYAMGWVVLLLGFVALARLLARDGQEVIPMLAVAALAVATVLGVLEATFHASVTIWVADEAARTGSTPAIYPVLLDWVGTMQLVYMILGFAAVAGFGWALLQTDLLPSWVGSASVAWGLGWLAMMAGFDVGVPAVLFLFPPVIGGALLALG